MLVRGSAFEILKKSIALNVLAAVACLLWSCVWRRLPGVRISRRGVRLRFVNGETASRVAQGDKAIDIDTDLIELPTWLLTGASPMTIWEYLALRSVGDDDYAAALADMLREFSAQGVHAAGAALTV